MMTLSGTFTTAPRPFLAKEPRLLIVLFCFVFALTFFIDHSLGLLVVLVYVTALLFMAGVPRSRIFSRFKSLAMFCALIVVVNGYFVGGRSLPAPLFFLSWEGLQAGVYYSLRVLVLIMTLNLFLEIVRPEAVAAGVAAFIRPFSPDAARRLALYSFLSIGYLPLFAEEIDRIRAAQRFRGGGMSGGLTGRLRSVRLLVVPLLFSVLHRSSQLTDAVHVRDIGNTIDNITGVEAPTWKDAAFAAVTLAVIVAAAAV